MIIRSECHVRGESSPTGYGEARTILVRGRVQGVGFRPSVARLAAANHLSGWVRNTPDGVLIHLEGPSGSLDRFEIRLVEDAPPAARITDFETATARWSGVQGFQILESATDLGDRSDRGSRRVEVTPDLASCPRCLAEFESPTDRHFGYALNGCTDCGPRFTLQDSTPFDRVRTAMSDFEPCPACRAEYESPFDRRFHAQNVACPRCGPRLWLESAGADGTDPGSIFVETSARCEEDSRNDLSVLDRAAAMLRAGSIIAVKGVGGFHLLCDATSEAAVARLRRRKRRERKPLAVLFESIDTLNAFVDCDATETAALTDPSTPIVLLRRRSGGGLARGIAPGLESIGAMLAYTPLHRELVRRAGFPLVATSANASDEPMPIDEAVARQELSGIADAFLLHDRRIVRQADDSIVRVICGRTIPLRVGRGLAPVRLVAPIAHEIELPPMLATGGHLKVAIALAHGREIWLGPHVGDMGTLGVRGRYRAHVEDLCRLLGIEPEIVVHDAHPDYFTTRYAQERAAPTVAVQHHHAHVMACLFENGVRGPALGVSWDGTGYGDDGGIWGGEFLAIDENGSHHRIGSFVPFPLVGGDRAAREPRRSAAGVCHVAGVAIPSGFFTDDERRLLSAALESPRSASVCTSAGRLFDAWAALLGLGTHSAYEGEAAIRLEEIADPEENGTWPVVMDPASSGAPGTFRIDWRPWIRETCRSLAAGTSASVLSTRFHNSLARATLEMARNVGLETVALTGGCFQNRLLAERVETFLIADGFRVLTHHRVPPGDGGLAVGQLWAAGLRLLNSSPSRR